MNKGRHCHPCEPQGQRYFSHWLEVLILGMASSNQQHTHSELPLFPCAAGCGNTLDADGAAYVLLSGYFKGKTSQYKHPEKQRLLFALWTLKLLGKGKLGRFSGKREQKGLGLQSLGHRQSQSLPKMQSVRGKRQRQARITVLSQ